MRNSQKTISNETQEEDASTEIVKGKFKWEAVIIGALLKADDNTLSIKKLRKKVFEYNLMNTS